jgi:hypothetical protein
MPNWQIALNTTPCERPFGLAWTFGGQISHVIGILAAFVLGLALVWTGYALWVGK